MGSEEALQAPIGVNFIVKVKGSWQVRAYRGVWGRSPQWGPGAEPLVSGSGSKAPCSWKCKLGTYLPIFYRVTAMLSAVYAVVVSVCVCPSDTLRYCIKTAKRRITQIMPHDSNLTLVFWCRSSLRNSNRITPYGGDKCRWSGLKFVTFDEKRAITRKRYEIDT